MNARKLALSIMAVMLVITLTVSSFATSTNHQGENTDGKTAVTGAQEGYPTITGEGIFVSWAVGPKGGILGDDYTAASSMNGFLYYKSSYGLSTTIRRSGLSTAGSFSKTLSSSSGGTVAGWPVPAAMTGMTDYDQLKSAYPENDSSKFRQLCADLGIPPDTIEKCLATGSTETIYVLFQSALCADYWPRPGGGPGWMSAYDLAKSYGIDIEQTKYKGGQALVNDMPGFEMNKSNNGFWNAGAGLIAGAMQDCKYVVNGVNLARGFYVITSEPYAGGAPASGHKLEALPDDKAVTVNPSTEQMTLRIKPDAANVNSVWATIGNPASANLNWTVSTKYSGVASANLSGSISVTKATLAPYLTGSGSIDCTPTIKPTVQVSLERVVVPWNSTLTLVAGSKSMDLGKATDNASFNPQGTNTPATQSWRSDPNARAEIKNNSYSANRSSETWDAMAGLPHTETLYVDVGASSISAALQAQRIAYTGMTSSASHANSRSHTETVGCSDCGSPICKWCGSHGSSCGGNHSYCGTCCSGHPIQIGTDPETGAAIMGTEDRRDGCACTNSAHVVYSRSNSQSFSFQNAGSTGLTMYEMSAWDVKSPTSATQAASFLAGSPVSMSAGISGSWAKVDKSTSYSGWPSPPGVYTCNPTQDAKWLQDSKNLVQAALPNIQVGIRTPSANITDREGRTHRVMVSSHFQWRGKTLSGTTVTFEPFNGNPYQMNGVSTHTVWGAGRAVSGEQRTNFRPVEEAWDPYDEFQIIGYNGRYSSPSSRRTGNALFYRAGIAISPTQTNGRKPAGATNVSYSQVAKQGSYNAIASTTDVSYGPGSEYSSSANAVTIHTPIAISRFEIMQDNLALNDQRVNPSSNPWKIYVDDWFKVTLDYNWFSANNGGLRSLSRSTRDSANTTDYLGPGYDSGMDTRQWIQRVEIRFPYEVVYEQVRRPANTYFTIPKNVNTHYFYLPLSEREVANAQPTVRVTATNAGGNEQPGATPHDNHDRSFGDLYTAAHAITVTQLHDVIGRLGNFAVEHIGDPNWLPVFRQGVAGQWMVDNVVPLTNTVPINYVGPHTDMFGWLTSNVLNLPAYWYLDRWNSVPTLHKKAWLTFPVLGGKLKYPAPYTNVTATKNEHVKLGYPVYFSMQSAGNYAEPGVTLSVNPTFVLRHKTTGATINNFHMYVKSGDKYIKIYETMNKAFVNPDYLMKYTLQMGSVYRNIGTVEKEKTQYRNSLSDMQATSIGDIFNKLNIYDVGSIRKIRMTQQQRTNIGSSTTNTAQWFAGSPTVGGASARTERDHERQGQRWHGVIMLPSSLKFTNGGSVIDFIDTTDYLLDVHLGMETEGATPWNLKESEFWAQIGSEPRNSDDDPKWGPPENPLDDVVVTFDPNKRANSDVAVHGTH